MRIGSRVVLVGMIGATACGGDSTSPAEKRWTGEWVAISLAAQALPAEITQGGYKERVIGRTLSVQSGGWASWKDSTLQLLPFAANGSQSGIMQWSEINATTLRVSRRSPYLGTDGVFFERDFTLRSDGTL